MVQCCEFLLDEVNSAFVGLSLYHCKRVFDVHGAEVYVPIVFVFDLVIAVSNEFFVVGGREKG